MFMNPLKKISVVVTVYNIDKFLSKCIESICAQTYKNIEVIIIDDGSTDDSPTICDSYAQKDKRIKVVHRENKGLVNARKQGVYLASGEYVAFVDGDDWITNDMFSSMMNEVEKNNSEIVVSGVKVISNEDERLEKNLLRAGFYNRDDLEKYIFPFMLYLKGFYEFGVTQYTWNKLYKRELINEYIGLIDDRITDGEDVALVYLLMLHANSLSIIDACNYCYRQSAFSMCHNLKNDYFENVFYLKKNLEDNLLSSKFAELLKPQVDMYIKMMLYRGITLKFNYPAEVKLIDRPNINQIHPRDNIILYGCGVYGKKFFDMIQTNNLCKIVNWVDKYEKGTVVNGYEIKGLDALFSSQYDKILLAVKNQKVAEEIKDDLIQRGITVSKIIWNPPTNISSQVIM